MDESGFTGTNLLDAQQPVFVAASNTLTAADARALLDGTLGPLPAGAVERSHSNLVTSKRGQARLVHFIDELAKHNANQATYHIVNKRFALLAKLIDNWIEPTMHRAGINLYDQGGAVAYTNMMYFCLRGFEGEAQFDRLLHAYQTFTKNATPDGFDAFFTEVGAMIRSARNAEAADLLAQVLYGKSLGYDHLESQSAPAHDIAYPSIFFTIAHWDAKLDTPFSVLHDESKNVETIRWMLEAVMNADTKDRHEVAFDARRPYTLPFRATGFSFGASQSHPQLQVSDLLAGAAASIGRYVIDRTHRPEYAKALLDSDIESMSIGMLWPDMEDIGRKRPRPASGIGDPLEETGRLILQARKSKSRDGNDAGARRDEPFDS